MKKYLLAAAAIAAIASPAVAQDTGGYAGIEAGVLFPQDSKIDVRSGGVTVQNVLKLDYNTGYDIDVVGGYDFGMFRLEGEIAHKRAGLDTLHDLVTPDEFDVDGHVRVWSAMINGLADFDVGGAGLYVGAGLGRGWVKFNGDDVGGDSDSAWAYQLVAGGYVPVSHNIDVGLKYRYFATQRLAFGIDPGESLRTHFRSHSLLASLIFNFGTAAPPPPPPPVVETAPPPPPPPATQVCPDGTTILATDMCPAAPTPPPPPPPAPERG